MKSRFLIIWANSGLTTKSNHVNAPYHFIHIGEVLNYINKNLKEKVDLLDLEAEQIQYHEVIKQIIKNEYKAIAFYTNVDNLQNTINLSNTIKAILNDTKTLAYGEMPLYLPEFFTKTKFDAIVSRQCDQEVAISDFFEFAIKRKEKNDLRGVLFVEDGKLNKSKDGCYLSPEEWGFPEKEEIPIEQYFKMEGKNQIVLTIARGCPYNCQYCNAVSYYGKKERRRPINKIVEYINRSNNDLFKFFAPNFTLDETYALQLCDALINNTKKIKWSCTTRPDLLKNEELIKKMAESGCYKIAIGIESIEKEDLKNIKKEYQHSRIDEGIKLLQKYGITYKALVMFGVPKQTKENIKYTLDFLNERNVTIRPTAYTPFYEMTPDMSLDEISHYDKRTYYEGINNLSYGNFLRLIYNTEDYKEILKKENR